MSAKREIVWSVSARVTLSSLPETTRKTIEKRVKVLADNPFADALKGRFHKVQKPDKPNLYYLKFGSIYRIFMEVLPERIEVRAIVDHPAMTELVKNIDRV